MGAVVVGVGEQSHPTRAGGLRVGERVIEELPSDAAATLDRRDDHVLEHVGTSAERGADLRQQADHADDPTGPARDEDRAVPWVREQQSQRGLLRLDRAGGGQKLDVPDYGVVVAFFPAVRLPLAVFQPATRKGTWKPSRNSACASRRWW